jgi:hypothetical protein
MQDQLESRGEDLRDNLVIEICETNRPVMIH